MVHEDLRPAMQRGVGAGQIVNAEAGALGESTNSNHLQRHIVGEEEVGGGTLVLAIVRDGWVELRQQEARLGAILVALDIHWHREALLPAMAQEQRQDTPSGTHSSTKACGSRRAAAGGGQQEARGKLGWLHREQHCGVLLRGVE